MLVTSDLSCTLQCAVDQDALCTRFPTTLDHDDAPQYLGPTLSTTNTPTAPQTQSKTTYVYLAPHKTATTAGSTKHQRADTRPTLPPLNQQNQNQSKLKKRTYLAGTAHRGSKTQNLRGLGTVLLTRRCDRPQQ